MFQKPMFLNLCLSVCTVLWETNVKELEFPTGEAVVDIAAARVAVSSGALPQSRHTGWRLAAANTESQL